MNVEHDDASKHEAKKADEMVEEQEKTEVDLTLLDAAEDNAPAEEAAYRIRPHLYDKFKSSSAKEIIHNVLFDHLASKTYNSKDAVQWTKDIADTIKIKIKELNLKHYKYIVNVVLGEQRGAGIKMGTRCIWDAETDSYSFDSFMNDTIFCVATVYAVYFY